MKAGASKNQVAKQLFPLVHNKFYSGDGDSIPQLRECPDLDEYHMKTQVGRFDEHKYFDKFLLDLRPSQ
jgi:hypothetical protein